MVEVALSELFLIQGPQADGSLAEAQVQRVSVALARCYGALAATQQGADGPLCEPPEPFPKGPVRFPAFRRQMHRILDGFLIAGVEKQEVLNWLLTDLRGAEGTSFSSASTATTTTTMQQRRRLRDSLNRPQTHARGTGQARPSCGDRDAEAEPGSPEESTQSLASDDEEPSRTSCGGDTTFRDLWEAVDHVYSSLLQEAHQARAKQQEASTMARDLASKVADSSHEAFRIVAACGSTIANKVPQVEWASLSTSWQPPRCNELFPTHLRSPPGSPEGSYAPPLPAPKCLRVAASQGSKFAFNEEGPGSDVRGPVAQGSFQTYIMDARRVSL